MSEKSPDEILSNLYVAMENRVLNSMHKVVEITGAVSLSIRAGMLSDPVALICGINLMLMFLFLLADHKVESS